MTLWQSTSHFFIFEIDSNYQTPKIYTDDRFQALDADVSESSAADAIDTTGTTLGS
jgi:hypothetical protein